MSVELHVIFGSGPLGQAVMRELFARGKAVRMVNRSGKRPDAVPETVEIMSGDAFQPEFTTRAAQGAAVVYQCSQPEYHEWTTKFIPLQTSILEGVAASGAKIVLGDNLYMYGEVNGPIHEGLPYRPSSRKGQTRAEAANLALEAHRSGKLRVAIGRGSDFFGPAVIDSAAGGRMFIPALNGKAAEGLGDIDLPHTYTYINDFGKALVILGERDDALGQAWNVPNAETVSTRRLIEIFFAAIGQPVKITKAGRLMMQFAGLFVPGAREMVEMMYEFEKPFVVDSSKFTRTFGMQATPLEESLKATAAWFKANASRREH